MELVKNFTQSKLIKNLFIALIGTVLLAISAKIKIPFYPVPMTMQTLVVLIIGVGFGGSLTTFSGWIYRTFVSLQLGNWFSALKTLF